LTGMQNFFNKYISYLQAERNASPYTVRNYTTDLMDFFRFLREREIVSLNEVDRHVVRGYLSWLLERGIAKASIARKASAIRSFYRYLVSEGMLPENPLDGVSSPKLDKRLPSFLTVDETRLLLESLDLTMAEGKRDLAFLELLYASGLRVSELVQLDLTQVDLASREVRVWGKGAKERQVLMGRPAAQALEVYLSEGRPELLGNKKSKALFLSRYGRRLTTRRVQQLLDSYAARAGIGKKVHPHMLRHTFATHLLDGGADLRVVQELLGHARLSSTEIYTHVTHSRARKVYLSAHPMAREESTGGGNGAVSPAEEQGRDGGVEPED
jgi:integrase/recombinase XerC